MDLLFDNLRADDEALSYHNATLYHYQDGAWESLNKSQIKERLYQKLMLACEASGADFSTRVSALMTTLETRAMSLTPPLGFDPDPLKTSDGPYVAMPNGMSMDLGADPIEVVTWDPAHYTTRRIDVVYDRKAGCPEWLAMLDRMLESKDRTQKDRKDIANFLQEWVGINLVGPAAKQTRPLKSGLIITGLQNTGKSTFSAVFRELVGDGNYIAPKLDVLSTQFGKSVLIDNKPIISDDGITPDSKADVSTLKRIITGEEMTIDRKNLDHTTIKYTGAVMWTCNMLPNIEDETDAVYSRFTIVTMDRVFNADDAKRDLDNMDPIAYLRKKGELPGILNWALEGYDRAYARGRFLLPPECRSAAIEFRLKNDPIFSGVRQCFKPSKTKGIPGAVASSILSEFALTQHMKKLPLSSAYSSARRGLREVFPGVSEEKDKEGRPIFTNVALTPVGKAFWLEVSSTEKRIPQLRGVDNAEIKLI